MGEFLEKQNLVVGRATVSLWRCDPEHWGFTETFFDPLAIGKALMKTESIYEYVGCVEGVS